MESLRGFARDKLRELERRGLRRGLASSDRTSGIEILRDGRRLLSFCCNDYLNLSQHPDVKLAAIAAIERFGTSAGASRLVTGNHSLFAELEGRLARWKGCEDACVFGSGYLTNVGVIPALAAARDLVLVDELAHACIHGGARMSRATVRVFRHNDMSDLQQVLERERAGHEHALVLTDGVFSMDGDLAPLAELGELCRRWDAWLMVDDAHGLGVLADGRGSARAAAEQVPLSMGTLSKATGSYGGYLCADEPVIELVRNRARPFVYSTGLPPASVAAAIAALDWIAAHPEQTQRPVENARRFAKGLELPEPQSCIVPLLLGDPERAMAASQALEQEGFLVTAIRPPTVPDGTARLRFTFTREHQEADVDRLVDAVRRRVRDAS